VGRLEGQLSHKELQLAKTSAQLSAAERHLATLEEDLQRERSARRALEAKFASLEAQVRSPLIALDCP
jgi:chromosome segregation ATPase